MNTTRSLITLTILLALYVLPLLSMYEKQKNRSIKNRDVSTISIPKYSTLIPTHDDALIACLSSHKITIFNPDTQKTIFELNAPNTAYNRLIQHYNFDRPDFTIPENHDICSMAFNPNTNKKHELIIKTKDDVLIYDTCTGGLLFKKELPGFADVMFHPADDNYFITHNLYSNLKKIPCRIQIHSRNVSTADLTIPITITKQQQFSHGSQKPILKKHPHKNIFALSLDSYGLTLIKHHPFLDATFLHKIILIKKIIDQQTLLYLFPEELKKHIVTVLFDCQKNIENYRIDDDLNFHDNNFIEFSADGKKIATASDNSIITYDIKTKKTKTISFFTRFNSYIKSMLFHPNNTIIIALDDKHFIHYFCAESGKRIHQQKIPVQMGTDFDCINLYAQQYLAINNNGALLYALNSNGNMVKIAILEKIVNYSPSDMLDCPLL
jgi:WD40 repeat protein